MASDVNTIRRKSYGGRDLVYYPVVIIGSGESGIAAGCQLKSELGTNQFRILERRAGPGGVWYTTRYPGAAGDIPALCYSFSFNQKNSWTDLHPPAQEIRQYLNDTIDKFKIRQNLQLNTEVSSARWIDQDKEWELEINNLVQGVGDLPTHERNRRFAEDPSSVRVSTETIRTKIIMSCVGALVEQRDLPAIPGTEIFKGQIVHSSAWDPTIDVRNKNVIVVGTGSSGSQIVPALIKPQFGAKSVLNIMRSPPWVEPTMNAEGRAFWDKWIPRLCKGVPGYQRVMRKIVFSTMELEFHAMFAAGAQAPANRQKRAEILLKYLRENVPEKYHEQLIPDYEVFCKRRVMGENWFKSLSDKRVELCTLPLTELRENSAILGPGRMYPPQSRLDSLVSNDEREVPVDILVYANGYNAGDWLHPLNIYGRAGASLHDVWEERGGPQAYLGQAMDGFPNFFIIHGPNTITGHSSVILASEMMVQHALHFIPNILSGTIDACEVKKEAEIAWTADIQARLDSSVWVSGGCSNWYTKDGWNSTVYPRSQVHFAFRCKNPRFNDWIATYTPKGLAEYRQRLGRGLPVKVATLPKVIRSRVSCGHLRELAISDLPRVSAGHDLPTAAAMMTQASSLLESSPTPSPAPDLTLSAVSTASDTSSDYHSSYDDSGTTSPSEISEAQTPPDILACDLAHIAGQAMPVPEMLPLDKVKETPVQLDAAAAKLRVPLPVSRAESYGYYESPMG